MLAQPFALLDVDDVPGFVAATIQRALPGLPDAEREELMAEGLAIMCELAAKYQPRRPGYAQDGRFSGYAAQFLPRRLGDAWHRLHPEHRYVTDPATGRRSWHYDQAPVSLDAIIAGGSRTKPGGDDDWHAGDGPLSKARRPHEFVPLPIPSCAA